MSSNHYLSSLYDLYERLHHLDDIYYFPETSIDIVQFFRWEFQFLESFVKLQSFIDEPKMRDVTQKVQSLFQDSLLDFSELYLAEYFDFYTSKVKNKILLTKMEIKAKYSFPKVSLPISAKDKDIAILKYITASVCSVAENLPKLVKIETMDHIKDFLKELDLLKYFVCFVSERFIAEPQSQDDHIANFFTHVLAVAGHATMLFWLYLPELAPEEIHVMLSDFLRMSIKPTQSCIRKIYVDVLQSLKSTMLQSGWCPHINEHEEANFLEICHVLGC